MQFGYEQIFTVIQQFITGVHAPATWLGLALLYMPPIFLISMRGVLNKMGGLLSFKSVGVVSLLLYGLMMWLMPEAWIAFTFYLVVFNYLFVYSAIALRSRALG